MLKLIRNRSGLVLAGLVAVLCPMLMAPSGGFPYFPFFGGVTVRNGPVAGAVTVTSTVAATSQRALQSTNSGAGATVDNAIQQANDAGNQIYLGISSSTYTGSEWTNAPTGPQAFVGASGNFPLCLASNNTARICLSSAVAGEQFRVIGNGVGNAAQTYFGFYDNAGTRVGYLGKTSNTLGHQVWESDNGDLRLQPITSTGNVTVSTDGGATFVPITPATATATGTITGCTTAPTTTVRYNKIGNVVTGSIDTLSCTNNNASVTLTGAVPAAFQPARQQRAWASGSNNGAGVSLELQFNSASTTITIALAGGGGLAGAGAFNIDNGTAFSYILN